MKYIQVICMISLLLSPIVNMRHAIAQVPSHPPGSICITPQFWCWVNPPGQAGNQCSCPSPYGRVAGRLG